jgi:Zn-finger in ubiquitin-hydrolases and other protein
VEIYELETEAGRHLRLRATSACSHLDQVKDPKPSTTGCAECMGMGESWVHLRRCLFCGHVGCCDDSRNRHATKHHIVTRHAVIESYEPDEDWLYCYADDVLMEPL